MNRLSAILSFLFLAVLGLGAQDVTVFTYSRLGKAEGMLSERVYSLRQSNDGALWWSTKKGVERYNGVSIRH